MEVYSILTQDLIRYTNDTILEELQGHTLLSTKKIIFPEEFFVKIDIESEEDTEGIQYFKKITDETPFLQMGSSDNGFLITAAFLKLAGKKMCTGGQCPCYEDVAHQQINNASLDIVVEFEKAMSGKTSDDMSSAMCVVEDKVRNALRDHCIQTGIARRRQGGGIEINPMWRHPHV